MSIRADDERASQCDWSIGSPDLAEPKPRLKRVGTDDGLDDGDARGGDGPRPLSRLGGVTAGAGISS